MKVRAIIQARMLSSRLRGKSLIAVEGIPLLHRVVQSIKQFDFVDEIMIATTHSKADDPIVAAAEFFKINTFRGDSVNVLKRFYDASADLQEEDLVLRFTADNPIYHSEISHEVFRQHQSEDFDYTCIEGLSHIIPEFIKVRALREIFFLAESEFDKEHVTPYFRKNTDQFKVQILPADYKGLIASADKYFTIDTADDLFRIEKMIQECGEENLNHLNILSAWLEKYNNTNTEHTIEIEGKRIGKDRPVFIIAEIGQNHNGNMQTAKQLIDMAVRCGADAVKFQKRDITSELTEEEFLKPYENPNSFGKTYGEHRIFLELNEEQHAALKQYATQKGITYLCTACDITSIEMMERLNVLFYKVASRDLTNIPLLERLAKTKKPVIISTGMAGEKEIKDALRVLGENRTDIIILHCISQYPAEIDNVNLNAIKTIQDAFGKITGYSDHTTGIIAPVAAAALGAAVIEKHITLSRAMKGTDQAASLEETGLRKMIEYIRLIERAMGDGIKEIHPASKAAKEKLARSITSARRILKGEVLDESMLTLKSPGTGLQWNEKNKLLGKKAIKQIEQDTTLIQSLFEE